MKRKAAAFVLGLLVALGISHCASGNCGDGCPGREDLLGASGILVQAKSFDAFGSDEALPFGDFEATAELSPSEVVIRYLYGADNDEITVRYAVSTNPDLQAPSGEFSATR